MANEVKIFSNIAMNKSVFRFEMFDTPPDNVQLGTTCMVNGVLSVYTQIDGVSFWLPLGVKRTFYKHVQSVSDTTWIVDHNLGTYDILVGLYDESNKLMFADYYFLSPDRIEVKLTEPKMGRCIVFGDSNRLAGFNTPDSLNQDTVSYGTEVPDGTADTTLYFQIEA